MIFLIWNRLYHRGDYLVSTHTSFRKQFLIIPSPPSPWVTFFIPCHIIVSGYNGMTLVVCVSVSPSVVHLSMFSFTGDILNKCQWLFTRLGLCIDIMEIWFGIAYGQRLSIFDRVNLPATSAFLCPDDNLNKYQWIFTKHGMCIDIVKSWFGIAIGQILSIFDCLFYLILFFRAFLAYKFTSWKTENVSTK